jgi:hypothetical protein
VQREPALRLDHNLHEAGRRGLKVEQHLCVRYANAEVDVARVQVVQREVVADQPRSFLSRKTWRPTRNPPSKESNPIWPPENGGVNI